MAEAVTKVMLLISELSGLESLTVAYYASAEIGLFLSAGWSLPKRMLDLYAEFRIKTNCYLENKADLLSALQWYGKATTSARDKDVYRDLVLKGAGTYTAEEKTQILN